MLKEPLSLLVIAPHFDPYAMKDVVLSFVSTFVAHAGMFQVRVFFNFNRQCQICCGVSVGFPLRSATVRAKCRGGGTFT